MARYIFSNFSWLLKKWNDVMAWKFGTHPNRTPFPFRNPSVFEIVNFNCSCWHWSFKMLFPSSINSFDPRTLSLLLCRDGHFIRYLKCGVSLLIVIIIIIIILISITIVIFYFWFMEVHIRRKGLKSNWIPFALYPSRFSEAFCA